MKQIFGSKFTYDAETVADLCSYLIIADYHQIELTVSPTQKDIEMCQQEKNTKLYYVSQGDEALWKVGSKAFFDDLLTQMESLIDGESTLKMKLNFAHDYTLAILIEGLEYKISELPPFGSTLFFELWMDEEDGSYEVVTLLNDEAITFGHCEESPCQFFTFKRQLMDRVKSGDIQTACANPKVKELIY